MTTAPNTAQGKTILIGIDPGVTTGFAVWDRLRHKWVGITSLSIVAAMEQIHHLVRDIGPLLYSQIHIRIEDARKSYVPEKDRKAGREQGAGSVKRDSQIWEEFCIHYGISYEMLSPQSAIRVPGGKWLPATKERKITTAFPKGKDCTGESFSRVVGWKGQTNGHERDAAMWVWGY